MSLLATKLKVVQKILALDQESIIKKIEKILENEMVVGFTVDGKPLTKKEYNQRIATAERQLKNGDVISQEDLEEESDNW